MFSGWRIFLSNEKCSFLEVCSTWECTERQNLSMQVTRRPMQVDGKDFAKDMLLLRPEGRGQGSFRQPLTDTSWSNPSPVVTCLDAWLDDSNCKTFWEAVWQLKLVGLLEEGRRHAVFTFLSHFLASLRLRRVCMVDRTGFYCRLSLSLSLSLFLYIFFLLRTRGSEECVFYRPQCGRFLFDDRVSIFRQSQFNECAFQPLGQSVNRSVR